MHKSLVGRAGDWIARKRYPHAVMFVAYSIAALVAYRSMVSLRYFGIQNHAILFGLSFLIGYAFFALWLSTWLCTVPSVSKARLMDGAEKEIQTAFPSDFVVEGQSGADYDTYSDSTTSFNTTGGAGGGDPASGLAAVAIAMIIMGLILSVVLSFYYSRWCLGTLMVRTGKIDHHSVDDVTSDAWLIEPFRQTIWPAMGLLTHVVLLGFLVPLAQRSGVL